MSKYVKIKKICDIIDNFELEGNPFFNTNLAIRPNDATNLLKGLSNFYVRHKYGDYKCVLKKSDSATDLATLLNFSDLVISTYNKYRWKWNELEKTMAYEYNPLYNVDGTETVTTVYGARNNSTVFGNDKTTSVYGEDKTTAVNGERVKSNEYAQATHTTQNGATLITNTFGETTETTQHGATEKTNELDEIKTTTVNGLRKTTTTEKVNPYNVEETATQKGQTLTVADEYTDTNTTAPRTDKESTRAVTDSTTNAPHTDTVGTAQSTDILTDGAHTDTIRDASATDTTTRDAHTDTTTRDSRTDTFSELSHTDTVTTVRQGNIGVTKTTELIDAQRETVNFIIIDIILNDVLREICFY